ncbi:MAG: hypothetical protein KatS3mg105_0358 [Gemmatales bacterium]|nr:MAG: hypothetical protein KatS3mg105_0358 [Gemmatales bacterium]
MTNDAKLGLVVGIGVVIVAAAVFSRKEMPADAGSTEPASIPVKPMRRQVMPSPSAATVVQPALERSESGIQHIVVEGDTLADLAEHYYGDARMSEEIFLANRHVLRSRGLLPIGAVLTIPKAPTARAFSTKGN